jgi:AraC-like DNA-binding protein
MSQLARATDTPPNAWLRSSSGLASYDRAAWLEPPPPVRRGEDSPSGLSSLIQYGQSANGRPQEILVDQTGADVLIILPDGSGDLEWHVEGRPWRCAGALSIVTLAAGRRTRWVAPSPRLRAIHLHFPSGILADLVPEADALGFEDRWTAPDLAMSHIAQAFIADLSRPGGAPPLLTDTYAALFARRILAPRPAAKPGAGGLAPWQVRRATDYLRARLAEPVTLAELAGVVKLSPFHFARSFRTSVGAPPHAYHCALRIERAMALLATSDRTITDIAAEVGCPSPQAFARLFRRHVGATPSAFRRDRRG